MERPEYGKIASMVQSAMDDEYGDSNATAIYILEYIFMPLLEKELASALAQCEKQGAKEERAKIVKLFVEKWAKQKKEYYNIQEILDALKGTL